MDTTILKIDGRIIQAVVDNDVKEYELESWIKPEYVSVGAAEITVKDGKVSFVRMKDKGESQAESKPSKPDKQDKKNIINIKGKDFMTYEGLLNMAHSKGKFDMIIKESWASDDMKRAWCEVRLTAGDQTFDGIGSSTPENTGKMTQDHPIEMAHTRAKGRALRDYLNIGQAMAEELKK